MVHLETFVFGFTFTLHTFTGVRTSGEGRPQVIGSSEPIVAAPGDDIILPCHVEPPVNVDQLTVTWWRPDVLPDPGDPLSSKKYVHCYHDNHDEEDMKMPSYAGRTALVKDGLKHGNVSLKVRNVTISDQGRYRCYIPQLGSATIIKLVVDPSIVRTRTETPKIIQTPDPKNESHVEGGRSHVAAVIPAVVLILLIILSEVCGFLLRNKCEKQKLLKVDGA